MLHRRSLDGEEKRREYNSPAGLIGHEYEHTLRWFQSFLLLESPPTLDEELSLESRNSTHHYHSDHSGADQLSQYPILLRIGSHRTKIFKV